MAQWHFNGLAHGCDYNPDQWMTEPAILEEDLRLMKLARCNLMSVGIFAWAALEPKEGVYQFEWLQKVLDGLYGAGVSVLLATPSGARPAWMSQKYPEVLRVRSDGHRNRHGGRHNHCPSSPIYREKVAQINAQLAERFGKHPAVAGWHVSNEYGGECFCPLCQEAFRTWLKKRYGSLEALNKAWWTSFWAKTYGDWSELEAPCSQGESGIHGLNLSWRRFVTDQTIDFMRCELAPLRQLTPELPVTTNFMGSFLPLDYPRFAEAGVLDIASWDSYPLWGRDEDNDDAVALATAFCHDLTRSLLRRPFLLMESTPSVTNWQPCAKLKRPGMHLLSSLQAVAHGADSVQYFQWRKSRGASEKFHGAVVDHVGHEHTRVFQDVRTVGEALANMACIQGSRTPAQAALLFDWENRWVLQDAQGPVKDKRHDAICLEHYAALKRLGLDVDVIDSQQDFSPYRLIVAPMLHMIKPGVTERLEAFVRGGGQLAMTYLSGQVDENDLCFQGGFPGPLRRLLGIWVEEVDALYPGQSNTLSLLGDAGLSGTYACDYLCELAHTETAQILAAYVEDFYVGYPALTVNTFGSGQAWYIAAHTGEDFLVALYDRMAQAARLPRLLGGTPLPKGLHVASRVEADGTQILFLMNFSHDVQRVRLPAGLGLVTGASILEGDAELPGLSVRVLRVRR